MQNSTTDRLYYLHQCSFQLHLYNKLLLMMEVEIFQIYFPARELNSPDLLTYLFFLLNL